MANSFANARQLSETIRQRQPEKRINSLLFSRPSIKSCNYLRCLIGPEGAMLHGFEGQEHLPSAGMLTR